MRADIKHRRSQLEIRDVVGIQFTGRHSEAGVDAVTAGVGADGISLGGMTNRADDGTADERVGVSPGDGDGVDAECVGVGG